MTLRSSLRTAIAAARHAATAGVLMALCGPASGEPTAPGALFDRSQALAFEHRCSEPGRNDNAHREALALFEPTAPAPGRRAIALGNVLVGWVGGSTPHKE